MLAGLWLPVRGWHRRRAALGGGPQASAWARALRCVSTRVWLRALRWLRLLLQQFEINPGQHLAVDAQV